MSIDLSSHINKGDRVRKIRKTKLNKKLNEERDGITLTYRDI